MAQQRAFTRVEAGDARGAETSFAQALAAFDAWLRDPDTREAVAARAADILGQSAQASAIAGRMMDAWPDWLRELHFEAFYRALDRMELHWAGVHWRLLELAAQLPALAPAIQLDTLRELTCQRQQVTLASFHETAVDWRRMVRRAEQILYVDGLNAPARTLAIEVHSYQIRRALDSGSDDATLRQTGLTRARAARARRRHHVHARNAARRLRRHLAAPGTITAIGRPASLAAHGGLYRYYLTIGDDESMTRLLRRCRRLFPADRQVREWQAVVRKLRRRR